MLGYLVGFLSGLINWLSGLSAFAVDFIGGVLGVNDVLASLVLVFCLIYASVMGFCVIAGRA